MSLTDNSTTNTVPIIDQLKDYVSIKTYADMYNISPLLLLEDIIEGKYQSAICLISKDEECKSSFSEKSRPKGTVSRSPDYILVKEYAAIRNLTASTVMKRIHQGKYKTAVKESNKWYIHKDDEEIKLMNGYVTAKEYADIHGIKYYTVLRDLSLGLYSTGYQDEGRHWFLNKDDVKQDPDIIDEFEHYIPTKEYCAQNGINYSTFLCDVRNGLYDESIKRKPNGRIFIREDAECITSAEGVRSYISIEKYASNNKVELEILQTDIENGVYNTAKLIDGRWYLKPQEKCHSLSEIDNYITLLKYAKDNNVDYDTLLTDVKHGKYHTAVKSGLHWYIDGNEKCKTKKEGNGFNDFLSIGEYAKLHNVTRKSISEDVRLGLYETAVKIGSYWHIHKDEPCKTLTNDYLSITAYASLHGIDRIKLRKAVDQGLYETVKKKNQRYFIHKDEPVKEYVDFKGEIITDNYLPVSMYATLHNVKRIKVLDDISKGIYETAKQIGTRWFIQKDEPCKTLTEDYISLSAYAKLHGVSRMKLLDDIDNGVYLTVIHKGSCTYIRKDEEFKSIDRRRGKRTPEVQEPQFISVTEYAKRHKFSYLKILEDVKNGIYDTAYQKGTRWLIDANEPCKSVDKRKKKNYIRISEYAKIHEISYQKMLSDVKQGIYLTAEQRNSRWFIDESEPVKSVDRRKKKN